MSLNIEAIRNYLTSPNIRLLGNMLFPDSPGHMITELDNFLRMRHLGEIPKDLNYFAIFPQSILQLPSTIAATIPEVFSPGSGIQIMVDDDIYKLANEINALRPELLVDPGVSHFKVILGPENDGKNIRYYSKWPCWLITHEKLINNTLQYFRRRWESRDFCPWTYIPELSTGLRHFLGEQCDKLALVHIRNIHRESAGNAGSRTDPVNLLPTLAYLRDMGYTIVKIGMEPYPPEWASFSVLNYSESPLRNYGNDMLLLKAAKLVMTNATGFENLSDILGTPMVSYGRWSLALLPVSPNCVNLPSLMRSKANGRLLKFKEQLDYYINLPELWEKNCLGFPGDEFDERPPTPDELLAATQEAIALSENPIPRSAEQEQFMGLDSKRLYAHCQSRISQQFLERFQDALATGFVD